MVHTMTPLERDIERLSYEIHELEKQVSLFEHGSAQYMAVVSSIRVHEREIERLEWLQRHAPHETTESNSTPVEAHFLRLTEGR